MAEPIHGTQQQWEFAQSLIGAIALQLDALEQLWPTPEGKTQLVSMRGWAFHLHEQAESQLEMHTRDERINAARWEGQRREMAERDEDAH